MSEIDLPESVVITLKRDPSGYIGRQCPSATCGKYFKVTPGTGVPNATDCYCAYCGHRDDADAFATPDQLAHGMSVAMDHVIDVVEDELQGIADEINGGLAGGVLGLSAKVSVVRDPIHEYQELALETSVVCSACTLRYAIYGVFAYCPDCGVHNSFQILSANIEVAEKKLALSATVSEELGASLIEDALKTIVRAFDGFGREACRIRASRTAPPPDVSGVSFQNLGGARFNVRKTFGLDISSGVTTSDWEFAIRCFQKRHVFDHRAGVVDQEYLDKTSDPGATIGRKLNLTPDEVRRLALIIIAIGRSLAP